MPSVYDNQENLRRVQQAAQNALPQATKSGTLGTVTANAIKTEQQTATGQGTAAPTTQAAGGYTGYSPSQAVLAAQQYLNQQLANKPGAYVSKYDTQLDSLLHEMMNRGPFTYDASADPLYNIYKDLYIQNGRRAMQETLGNAAALTGGYGSSYGQSAAQQMYNQYMEALNARVPELQQQAYQRYSDEGDRMAQNFQLMNLLENQNYGRYRDTVSDWQMDRSYAYQAALNAEQMDRQQFQYDTTFRENQRQFDANEAYRQAQLAEQIRQADLAADQWLKNYEESIRQYNQNFGENQRQFDIEQALAQAKFDLTLRQYEDALAAAGSGGGSGAGDTKKSEEEKKNTEIEQLVTLPVLQTSLLGNVNAGPLAERTPAMTETQADALLNKMANIYQTTTQGKNAAKTTAQENAAKIADAKLSALLQSDIGYAALQAAKNQTAKKTAISNQQAVDDILKIFK